MNKISVVIIALNAERTIQQVIEAALKVSDDIVVIDSYSKDNTKTICLNLNVNFIQRPFNGYSEQKNFGNKQAKYNWILSLDSDEVLSNKLIESINALKLETQNEAYKINFLNYYCGKFIKHGLWHPDWHIRLFNKNHISWNEQNVLHEGLMLPTNVSIKKLKGNVLHYSYFSLDQHIAKSLTYSNLFVKQLLNNNIRVSLLNIIINPLFKFIKSYILRFGFRDGIRGLILSIMLSWETFLKYAKLWLEQQKQL